MNNIMNTETCRAILDSVKHPIVFVDNEHVIRFLNRAAKVRYYEERGYSDFIGKPLFDCHKPESASQILQFYQRLREGENEIFLKINKYQEKVTLVAVRDNDGVLLGYYERFEGNNA